MYVTYEAIHTFALRQVKVLKKERSWRVWSNLARKNDEFSFNGYLMAFKIVPRTFFDMKLSGSSLIWVVFAVLFSLILRKEITSIMQVCKHPVLGVSKLYF